MSTTPPTADPARTALLVMDYQNGILERMPEPAALLGTTAGAIALMRARGGHIGHVRVAFTDADLASFPATSMMGSRIGAAPQAFHADSPSTATHDDVAPQAGEMVVRKTRVGAFSTTDLHAQLQAREVDTVILAGVSTSGCVLSTVRDASDRDYRVFVLADACADPEPDVHAFLTERIFPRQAHVITSADLESVLSA